MGYFRIFYYIAYIFNTVMRIFKRYGKQILWITAIFVFLCICMYNPKSSAFTGANYDYSDPNTSVFLKYDSICLDFIRRADYIYNNYNDYRVESLNILKNLLKQGKYLYLYYSPSSSATGDGGLASATGFNTNSQFIYAVAYYNSSYFVRASTAYENYEGIDTPMDSFYMSQSDSNVKVLRTQYATSAITCNYIADLPVGVTIYVPRVLFNNVNFYIYEYFVNGKTLDEIELLYEMNNKLSSIEDTMTELPATNSISSDEIPTDSGVDTSDLDTGLNGLFGQIAEAFTDIPRSKYNITVPVPFTNKSFVIPYNLTSSALSDSNFSWVTSIISAFWYYVVGRYILIDIINKFEHIQSGNIENMENDNIKEDLL